MNYKFKVWGRDGFFRTVKCKSFELDDDIGMMLLYDDNGLVAGFNMKNYFFEIEIDK